MDTYKAYYTNGEFKIAVNINCDDVTDVFNGIVMGNEKLQLTMEFLSHLIQEKV